MDLRLDHGVCHAPLPFGELVEVTRFLEGKSRSLRLVGERFLLFVRILLARHLDDVRIQLLQDPLGIHRALLLKRLAVGGQDLDGNVRVLWERLLEDAYLMAFGPSRHRAWVGGQRPLECVRWGLVVGLLGASWRQF